MVTFYLAFTIGKKIDIKKPLKFGPAPSSKCFSSQILHYISKKIPVISLPNHEITF